MIGERYITIPELSDIQAVVRAFNVFKNNLDDVKSVSTDALFSHDGWGMTFKVTDENGDIIGHVGFCDAGEYAFYLDDGNDA